MAKFDEKDHIILLDERIEYPESNNAVRVEDDDTGLNSTDWPYIRLSASKTTLISNGTDWCYIYADVRIPGGDPADVAPKRDKATPYNPRNIRTSDWMITHPRVYEAVGDELGDEIPVDSWEEREIVTSIDMERKAHFIVYDGAETVTFSIDQYGDIEPTEVPALGGRAETVLKARAAGGGYGYVTGGFQSQESKLQITFSDPTVKSIAAEANPGNIESHETSVITARVTAPDGNPVADGVYVRFNVATGYDFGPALGQLSKDIDQTSTSDIVNEECWSTDEISVSTYFPISELLSIKIEKSENARNYALGATFLDRSIDLLVGLPKPVQKVYVTYRSGGIAQTTFKPYTIADGGFTASGEAIIECWAGVEMCTCSVVVNSAGTGSKGDSSSSSSGSCGSCGGWMTWEIKGVFLGSPDEPRRAVVTANLYNLIIASGCSIDPDRELEWKIMEETYCSLDVSSNGTISGYIFGRSNIVQKPWIAPSGYIHGDIYVQGKKEGSDDFVPVPYHELQILWENYGDITVPNLEETEDTDGDAISSFVFGRLGTHEVVVSAPNWDVQTKELTISEDNLATGANRTEEIWEPVNYYGLIMFRVKPMLSAFLD